MRRSTSATGVPVSACFSANAICSSVNLLFFTAPLLPSGSHKTGKLAFKPDEKNGKTSDLKVVSAPDATGQGAKRSDCEGALVRCALGPSQCAAKASGVCEPRLECVGSV